MARQCVDRYNNSLLGCCNKVGGLMIERYCLLVLGARSPRVTCPQGWFPLRAVKKNLFRASHLTSQVFWKSLMFLSL